MMKLNTFIFLLALLIELISSQQPQFIFRQTKFGKFRGVRRTFKKKEYDLFSGIRYAQPPINDLRFKLPVKLGDKKPDDVIDAVKPAASCYQDIDTSFDRFPGAEMWNPNTEISEDCLFLNIYLPANSSGSQQTSKGKAVMMFIYGGGFYSGTSTLDVYNGFLLSANYDVILVTFQYRVGPFGFLYMGDEEAPGNAGLFDQQLALKWVHKHISEFGGDPNRVTLFGESAGSVSVSYHLLNEKSSHYFSQAILQSGSANAEYTHLTPKEAKSRAKMLAERVGCHQTDKHVIISCLKRVNASSLSREQDLIAIEDKVVIFAFVPVIDGLFVEENPVRMIKRAVGLKQKKTMIGWTEDEGTFFVAYQLYDDGIYRSIGSIPSLTNDQVRSLAIKILGNNLTLNDQILPHYNLGAYTSQPYYATASPYDKSSDRNLNPAEILLKDISKMAGDRYFQCPLLQLGQAMMDHGAGQNLYMYQFSYRLSSNPWPLWTGVLHGDECVFQFGVPLFQPGRYSDMDKIVANRTMAYWTNFAKYGNPNHANSKEWSPSRTFVIAASDKMPKKAEDRQPYCRLLQDLLPNYLSGANYPVSNILPYLMLIFVIYLIKK